MRLSAALYVTEGGEVRGRLISVMTGLSLRCIYNMSIKFKKNIRKPTTLSVHEQEN